jgi:hypothetical protein
VTLKLPAHASVPQRVVAHGLEAARHSGQGTREIVTFVEAAEERGQKPFNRFAD